MKRHPPPQNVRRVASIGNNLRGTVINKTGRIVQFESFAERSLLLRFERDPTVSDYNSQPETFHDAFVQRYTPDFMVWRVDGEIEIHEVTRSERREKVTSQNRETLGRSICHERGWKYMVHTEADLPHGSELANLQSLFRYRVKTYFDRALFHQIQTILQQENRILLIDMIRLLNQDSSLLTACICHLLWHDLIVMDWNQTLFVQGQFSPKLQIWPGNSEVSQ